MSPKRARSARGARPPQRPRPGGAGGVPARPTAVVRAEPPAPAEAAPLPEAWPFSLLPEPWPERALRTVATIVLGWAGFLLAVLGVYWSPLMIGTVRVPVSVVLAV